jgi:fibronectin type 3 domain-containing protein
LYYGVEAYDAGGNLSPMSTVVTAVMPMPPAAPGGLTASQTSATMAGLTWSAAAGSGLPIAAYQVFRGSSPANLSQIGVVLQTSYTDKSVTPGGNYYYAVQAKDSGGDLSPMSAVVTLTAPMPPSAPGGVSANATSAGSASVTWAAAASGGLPIQYYFVFRGSSPSALTQIATVIQTSYTDNSLTAGNTYYYAVEAKDTGADISPMSNISMARTLSLPSPPAGLTGTPNSSAAAGAAQVSYSVSLSWSAAVSSGLPIQFYQVFRGSSPSSLSQIGVVGQTAYTDNAVTANTAYYYAVIAGDTGGDLSPMSGSIQVTTLGGPTAGAFNILPMTIYSFTPASTILPGLPSVELASGISPSVGYQGGVVLNGQAIYFPWQVPVGGSTWTEHVLNGLPQSVMLAYNTSQGPNGFNNPSNWTYFDLSTLPWYSKGGIQGNNALPNLPAGFLGNAVAGNMVYLTPKGGSAGPNGGAGPYPVFVQYNSQKAINDPTAYQTFVPPPMGTTMGYTYGWCTAVFDGRFIYYAPLSNNVTGNSGNIFRYDTTQPFSNLNSGGATPAWENFDMYLGRAGNPGGISPNAQGFQAIVYDSHRYIYYIPFHNSTIVRYDTWNGGTGPDPTGFQTGSNYVTFDTTQLGNEGYPAYTGQGNTANLTGFTGADVVWDAAQQNQYLYIVPWAIVSSNTPNPIIQSTAARVRIGTMTGSAWSPVDITSTVTSPASSAPDWEIYDLNLLTQNPAWLTSWPATQNNSSFAGLSAIAGFQAAFTVTSNSSGATFPPRVVFVPDTSQYLVEHDVAHDLFDPTGWYVAPIPSAYSFGTMGGGYDAANSILYPASPNPPLFAFQF